jgi:hypothetical protein
LDSLFIVRFYHSELIPQNGGNRGAGSLFKSPVWGGEEGGGGGTKGHPRIIRIAEKSQTIDIWSDRASNYFVSGEDNIKTGSIPDDTKPCTVLPQAYMTMVEICQTFKFLGLAAVLYSGKSNFKFA